MSQKRQIVKATTKIFNKLGKQLLSAIKRQLVWLLRTFFIPRRRRDSVNAGFLLPTVAMVSIVVVLLTAAILFRSFERSKNASNVRVNEVVIKAASPALDRAKAKINELFQDPRLPRSTPSDLSLSQVINDNINEYTFGDETQLKLVKEFNGTANIQDEETLKTAWKYPVDTDNNGKFDSFTIYGIYFRTPTTTRPRSSIEARTQPMDEGATSSRCASDIATSADLVGSQGWYKVGSKLKRSIFVYTTSVPITDIDKTITPALDNTKYEKFTGNKGFAALEYQQDRERVPLSNNAVIYEDDLEIAPGAGLYLNGRIFTNGNLLAKEPGSPIIFYLVSSPKSCYYTEENSKIIVAGNVINSRVNDINVAGSVQVDLFAGADNAPNTSNVIDGTNNTVPTKTYGNTAAYNDQAYVKRIERLVDATNNTYPNNTDLPDEVQDQITRDLAVDLSLDAVAVRNEELKIYFRKRTRRVPFAEVPLVGGDPIGTYTGNTGTTSPLLRENKNALRPRDIWAFPFNPADGITATTATGYTGIGINPNGTNKIYLKATDPAEQAKANKELTLGDRVLVGNNMPQFWYDSTKSTFVSSPDKGQTISSRKWDFQQDGKTASTVIRQRYSQAYQLDNLGVTDRDDFWEKSASQKPTGPLDVVGGLRVITGAGIYLPDNRTSTSTSAEFTADLALTNTVWADSMPMGVKNTNNGLPNAATPYLKMRATAVYHYDYSSYDLKTPATPQTPIACVASYYDPTNSTTAKNRTTDFGSNPLKDLTGVSTVDPDDPANTSNNSLNGIVYSASSLATTNYTAALNYQASLKYPNGRWVNQPLKNALANTGNLTLSQQSAIDSAVCALKILDGTIGKPITDKVPHGAIRETTFLDARQIKAIDNVVGSKNYDLDIELRQPLEIRATILDLDLLRKKSSKTGGEFLFPNSGIIYATRDDALPDQSNATSQDVSATDFKLDPTRRPHGIMLINGSDLSRNPEYKAEEKGLILASNLPVYIQAQLDPKDSKGYFNKHTQEEFGTNLTQDDPKTSANETWDNFYTRSDLNPQFACRKKQFESCTIGETWRPATVIADGITVLSHNFRLGYRQEGDYDLRDNYGNYVLGYDLNGNGGSLETAQIPLDETAIRFDVNGDGDSLDTAVNTIDEPKIGADLNNDGDQTDLSVKVTESNITATVAARLNGFWDNNFVTSRSFLDSDYSSAVNTDVTKNPTGSSYFNNFVTPIQRRGTTTEYVMEICRKPTVTACKPDDWVVGYDADGNGKFGDAGDDANLKANQLTPNNTSYTVNKLGAGTTARPALVAADQSFPRRVAFLRDTTSGNLILTGTAPNLKPIPIGVSLPTGGSNIGKNTAKSIDDAGQVSYYPFHDYTTTTTPPVTYRSYLNSGGRRPRLHFKALWFKGDGSALPTYSPASANYSYTSPLWIENASVFTTNEKIDQPLLVPVLQLQYTNNSPPTSVTTTLSIGGDATGLNWMQRAVETETNLVFAQGNTPERQIVDSTADIGESNGGLENFVRYLETWDLEPGVNKDPANTLINHKVSGSFIQFKRSSYATAPWQVMIAKGTTLSKSFNYPQDYAQNSTNTFETPFYAPPKRLWGYDVALLTQLPDLFSQRFTAPSVNAPNEFYREVGRDDNWVKTLLCAAQTDTKGYGTADSTKYGTDYKYAISSDQRPTTCP